MRVEGGANSALGSVRCVPVCSLLPRELVFLAPLGHAITCVMDGGGGREGGGAGDEQQQSVCVCV